MHATNGRELRELGLEDERHVAGLASSLHRKLLVKCAVLCSVRKESICKSPRPDPHQERASDMAFVYLCDGLCSLMESSAPRLGDSAL